MRDDELRPASVRASSLPITSTLDFGVYGISRLRGHPEGPRAVNRTLDFQQDAQRRHKLVCVCLLLQYQLQSCSREGTGIVEDMCYERRRAQAKACVDFGVVRVCPSCTVTVGVMYVFITVVPTIKLFAWGGGG